MKFNSNSVVDTKNIAEMFASNLYPFSNILIFWEMWAGKTHFIKYLLAKLWVETKVKSPTYTLSSHHQTDFFVNLHRIKGYSPDWEWKEGYKTSDIWHYDLYRLESWSQLHDIEDHFSSIDDFVIVEWAERLKLRPKNRIEVIINKNKDDENMREVEFKFFSTSFSSEKISSIIAEFKTPPNVIKHIAQVANVADSIARNLVDKWVLVDEGLVHTGAMLHDVVRYVDFKWWIDPKRFEDLPEWDLDFMNSVADSYKGVHHSYAAWDLILDMWFPEIASVVKAHNSYQAFHGFNSIEEKIVYYADKRVLHDKVVTIKERMEDGKVRYGGEWWDKYWIELENHLRALEEELLVER